MLGLSAQCSEDSTYLVIRYSGAPRGLAPRERSMPMDACKVSSEEDWLGNCLPLRDLRRSAMIAEAFAVQAWADWEQWERLACQQRRLCSRRRRAGTLMGITQRPPMGSLPCRSHRHMPACLPRDLTRAAAPESLGRHFACCPVLAGNSSKSLSVSLICSS